MDCGAQYCHMDCGFPVVVAVDVDVADAVAADIVVEAVAAADTVAVDVVDAHCPYFPSCRRRQRTREPSGTDSYSDDHPRLDENLAWKDWVVVAVVGVTLVVDQLAQAEAAGDMTAERVVEPVPVPVPEAELALVHSDDYDSQ
jgi:hypothetical protein